MPLRLAQEADRRLLAPVFAHSFSFALSDVPRWLERAGHDNIHVLEDDGVIVGGFIGLPMGQFFGGRRVSMLGIASVVVPVPHRGKGTATRLMTEAVRLARARGYAISTLFPTTVTVYQRAGYERAGHRMRTTVDLNKLRLPRSQQRFRVEEHAAPTEEVKALYRELATTSPGYLDRGPYVWGRMTASHGASKRTFTFHREGHLEAYVVLAHLSRNTDEGYVAVVDAAATNRSGGEAIWRLLSEYQSVAGETTFCGGSDGFMHSLLPERHYKTEWVASWMLRICDPELALSQRGYPPVSARITFILSDGVLAENSAAYSLTVVCGEPTVKSVRSEQGVRITERGLAALFSGFLSPWELRRLDLLVCTDDESALLALLFAGRSPSMPDDF